ncbi:MAG: efflux RND transporter periplasmic adaptor subunit [Porticoccaceae bacterium]
MTLHMTQHMTQHRATTRLRQAVACCLGLIALAILGCDKAAPPTPVTRNALELPVATVAVATLPVAWNAVGTVVSDQRIDVTSKMTGYIRTLHVREGEPVKAGQLLASLDGSDVDGGIHQAQGAVDTAAALLADAQADLGRYQNLFDAGSIAEVQLRKARLQRDTLTEQLKSARAALDTARAQRDYTSIVSPTAGVVVARYRQAGDLATPGAPILTVESPDLLMFDTFVTDAHLAKIVVGDAVEVKVEGALVTGRVARIVPSSDPVTRKFQVKVALPAHPAIRPGIFGRAQFLLDGRKQPVIHPTWLVERGGLRGVFVVDEDQRAHFRWLRTQREWPDKIEVVSGLSAGETVVAANDPRLREGDTIVPAHSRADPAPATGSDLDGERADSVGAAP